MHFLGFTSFFKFVLILNWQWQMSIIQKKVESLPEKKEFLVCFSFVTRTEYFDKIYLNSRLRFSST